MLVVQFGLRLKKNHFTFIKQNKAFKIANDLI